MNEREFETFYCETAPRLRRYLARLCDDAEELVQETFFRFLRAGYTAMGEEQARLLFTIATNLARNRWSRKRDAVALDDSSPAQQRDPAERLDLLRALGKLAPRERAIVWLACAEGYHHADVARILGVGRASVRVLLFRAKRKLIRHLEDRP